MKIFEPLTYFSFSCSIDETDDKMFSIPVTPLKYGIGNRPKSMPKEERKRYTISDLKPGPDLEKLGKRSRSAFHVTHFYDFNIVHIVESEAYRCDIPLLKEDIYNAMTEEGGRKPFENTPSVGELLLAPLSEHYARAVVEYVHDDDDSSILVRFVDVGSKAKLSVANVFQISKDLLEVPILGAEVSVKDVTSSSTDMILYSEFHKFVREWPIERKCVLKSAEQIDGKLSVNMEFAINGTSTTLSQEIVNLGKWEWERRLEKMTRIDEDVLTNVDEWDELLSTMHTRQLPVDKGTKVTVISNTAEEAEVCCLLNVETEDYFRDKEVLQRQIEHYVGRVAGKEFYPAIDECVFVKILPEAAAHHGGVGLRGMGKWNRCIRDDNVLVNMDELEAYPLELINENFFNIRKGCPDFFKLQMFSLICRIKDFFPLNEQNQNLFASLTVPGSIITLTGIVSEPSADDIEEVSCEEFHTRMLEMAD